MGRAPCCDKTKVKKGPWSPEEDDKLKSYIDKHGTGGNWIALPQKIGLKRCGKSCRLRWLNYLRPNIKHGGFSEEEDNIICSLYINIGSRWSIIAAQLPGRTDNDIKNYWNTRLKKKLLGKQRKEQQAHNRRAAATLKQQAEAEIKKPNTTTNEFHLLPNGFVNNQVNPYWAPELPIMPMMSYQAHEVQALDHDHQVNPFYQNLGNDYMLSSSQQVNTNYGQLGPISPSATMFNEAELSELVYGSSQLLDNQQHYDGMASFYQMEASRNGGSPEGTTSTSVADSEISWGDINSMVCTATAPMVSNYERSCQEVVPLSDSDFHAIDYCLPFY